MRESTKVRGWLGPLAVALLAFVLRVWNLGYPKSFLFDETYYAKDAYSLTKHGYVQDFVDKANDRMLDGTFPHHEANPLDSSTLVDLQAAVLAEGADIGLAFDGDADRCFVIDERGEVVTPSAITALIADRYLRLHPGATILHNVITSKAVPEIIAENGGVAVRTPVGHSLIKAEMARTGAVFGGEHSGHFYFQEFFLADSGMLAGMHVLAALAETDGTVSELMTSYSRYEASGEINSTVDDAPAVLAELEAAYAGKSLDHMDGLTVTSDDWWFNVRASNTEPLLRLNVEGADQAIMASIRDDVLGIIRGRNQRES